MWSYTAYLIRWSAWSPEIETPEQWFAWSNDPAPKSGNKKPDVSFLPADLRRRSSQNCRLALHVAWDLLTDSERACVPSVFGSRHGESQNTHMLLSDLSRNIPLSPMAFTRSVHNTASGMFSIAAGNRAASTAIAGGYDSFAYSFLEALAQLASGRSRKVLVVISDELICPALRHVVCEPDAVFAAAFLLSSEKEGMPIEFRLDPALASTDRSKELQQGLEFISWLLGPDAGLSLHLSKQDLTAVKEASDARALFRVCQPDAQDSASGEQRRYA